jgi:carbamoyltransferase
VAAAEEERFFAAASTGKTPVAFSTWELPEQVHGLVPGAHDGGDAGRRRRGRQLYDPASRPRRRRHHRRRVGGLRTLYARRAPRFLRARCRARPGAVRWVPHHVAHAASATFASGFDPCSVLVLDGRGERASHLAGRAARRLARVLAAQRCRTRSGCSTRS